MGRQIGIFRIPKSAEKIIKGTDAGSIAEFKTAEATDVVTISNGVKYNFSWESGYGGLDMFYCLSAYPNMNGTWEEYYTKGTWGN